jgi:hypothetical protein
MGSIFPFRWGILTASTTTNLEEAAVFLRSTLASAFALTLTAGGALAQAPETKITPSPPPTCRRPWSPWSPPPRRA